MSKTVEAAPVPKTATQVWSELDIERQELDQWLTLYSFQAERIVEKELDEGTSSFKAGSESLAWQNERDNKARRLERVKILLPSAHKRMIAEKSLAQEKALGELREELEEAHKDEREAWRAMTRHFCSFFESYLRLAHDTWRLDELYHKGVEREVPDKERWRRECAPVITPFPADLLAAMDMILSSAIDPLGRGVIGIHVKLAEILPDLRSTYRHPELPAGFEKKYADTQAQSGRQPVGYTNHRLQQEG